MNQHQTKPSLVITIDGVSASGKGTLAKLLAKHFTCNYLPTGNLYRLVAKEALSLHTKSSDINQLTNIATHLPLAQLESPELSTDTIAGLASEIAQIPELRQILSLLQKKWVNAQKIAIIEGRDIGTIICPDADVKLFLTASTEARAKRRILDLNGNTTYQEVYDKLLARDQRDSTREMSPLTMAADAILIDSTNLTKDEVLQRAISVIEAKIREKGLTI